MTIVVCDDDKGMLQEVEAFCNMLPYRELRCCTYEKPMALLSDIEEGKLKADAYILDIDMPGLSGIEIKNQLIEKGNLKSVIFLTSHMEMMQDAFGRNVVAFLAKNNWEERLRQELDRVYAECNTCISLDVEGKAVELQVRDIISINAADYYSRVLCSGNPGDGWLVKKTLKAWETELPGEVMYRISRHAILNMENIERYEGRTITMVNGDVYTIPKGRIKKFREVYFTYMKGYGRIL